MNNESVNLKTRITICVQSNRNKKKYNDTVDFKKEMIISAQLNKKN